jgi:hypothetical protein
VGAGCGQPGKGPLSGSGVKNASDPMRTLAQGRKLMSEFQRDDAA